MSLQTRLNELINAIGGDISSLIATRGSLAALTTTDKSNLVAALNEVRTLALSGGGDGVAIDDNATGPDAAWSAQKVAAEITAAIDAVVAGAPAALDTLHELATELQDQESAASALTTAVGNRVRFDAPQSLTTAQKLQACENIGIGDPDVDLAAAYATAKA